MLARPDQLPRGDFGFEVKWDGFRALVSTEERLHVRSRRGWDMSERLPELADLPAGLVLDGELVAFAPDGRPSFPLLGLRVPSWPSRGAEHRPDGGSIAGAAMGERRWPPRQEERRCGLGRSRFSRGRRSARAATF